MGFHQQARLLKWVIQQIWRNQFSKKYFSSHRNREASLLKDQIANILGFASHTALNSHRIQVNQGINKFSCISLKFNVYTGSRAASDHKAVCSLI